jgi:putative transposase
VLAGTLAQWIGCQRVASNAKHDELQYLLWLRKRAIVSPSWTDPDPQGDGFPLDQTFSQFKDPELSPWLSEVPSQVLRNGVVLYKRGWSNRFKNPAHFRSPRRKRKWDRNSVWLTRELFRFLDEGKVEIGTAANPVGVQPFVQHRHLPVPNSLTITRTRYGHWFLSYATDGLEGPEMASDEVRLKDLASRPGLEDLVLGIDRGVVFNAACSDGSTFKLDDELKVRIQKLEKRRKRHQRKAARGQVGSHRRDKVLGQASRCSARIASIRNDFFRKIAFAIAKDAPLVVALEDLNLKGMTKRAKAKRDEAGKWLRNGATQKTGLNKSLANAGMGNFGIYTEQALRKLGKMLVHVPAHHSSQECSECGFTDPGNRPNQDSFLCLRCGFSANADLNASRVIKKRGIALIRTAGTAGSALRVPKGRGDIRRNQGEQPAALSLTRETPSSKLRPCAA